MSTQPLTSYAQNGEDIVLWRALGHLDGGIFVDVGGWDPDVDSVTRLFYERGWRGIDVEPVPELAEAFRRQRPRDEVVQAAITDRTEQEVLLHRFGSTGLSTLESAVADEHDQAGLEHEKIRVPALRLDDVLEQSTLVDEVVHFLKVDVEGAEDQVLASVDLQRWRPWVLVIEATEPNTATTTHQKWEPMVLAAGYVFTLFDGLSRYYVSPDHAELAEALGYPACALDRFETAGTVSLRAEADRLHGLVAGQESELQRTRDEASRWRNEAVTYWANAAAATQAAKDDGRQAHNERRRMRAKLNQTRERLEQARADRRRLRQRVERMRARIERLEQRAAGVEPVTGRRRVRTVLKRLARR